MGKQFVWVLALGLGLGSICGAVISSGISLDAANVSRFAGALVGSLIAVCGAVSLHYLKEYEDEKNIREDYVDLMNGVILFSRNCKDRFENPPEGKSLKSALLTGESIWQRSMRYGRNYEFDSHAVGHAYHMLSPADHDFSEQLLNNEWSEGDRILVATVMELRMEMAKQAIEELRVKNPRKSR